MLTNVKPPSLLADSTHIHAGDLKFPLTTSAKCLGALWSPNLSCTKWIEDNIKKAFFARGSGVFHGTLNPLSSKSIIEHCVLPCLLFGAETWILNSTLLQKLESFQAELAKRILRLPKCTSNNTSHIALQWPSMHARILIIKLCFMLKVINSDHSRSTRLFRSLAVSDVESLIITRQGQINSNSQTPDVFSYTPRVLRMRIYRYAHARACIYISRSKNGRLAQSRIYNDGSTLALEPDKIAQNF